MFIFITLRTSFLFLCLLDKVVLELFYFMQFFSQHQTVLSEIVSLKIYKYRKHRNGDQYGYSFNAQVSEGLERNASQVFLRFVLYLYCETNPRHRFVLDSSSNISSKFLQDMSWERLQDILNVTIFFLSEDKSNNYYVQDVYKTFLKPTNVRWQSKTPFCIRKYLTADEAQFFAKSCILANFSYYLHLSEKKQ